MPLPIKINKIQCNHCGDIIVSKNVHDYVRCGCGKVAVDGGTEYLSRSYTNDLTDYTELSEYDAEPI